MVGTPPKRCVLLFVVHICFALHRSVPTLLRSCSSYNRLTQMKRKHTSAYIRRLFHFAKGKGRWIMLEAKNGHRGMVQMRGPQGKKI